MQTHPLILIVDDEPLVLETLERKLAPRYKVIAAFNGEEGLQAALSHRPALILADLSMPKMNGFELFKALRMHPETEHTPFVLLTARGETQLILEAQKMGITDYLTKPVHLEDLPKILGRYL